MENEGEIMARLILTKYGYLCCGTDLRGNVYDDWRSSYYRLPGLIAVYASEKKRPGSHFVYFYPYGQGNRHMHTSIGKVVISPRNTRLLVTTDRSFYVFKIDDSCLSDTKKKRLHEDTGIEATDDGNFVSSILGESENMREEYDIINLRPRKNPHVKDCEKSATDDPDEID